MHDDNTKPEWFALGDELLWPLIGMGLSAARNHKLNVVDLEPLAELAFCHHAGCIEASMHANERGKHSAAICLIRQSVEALTVAEIGLQSSDFAEPLLRAWKEGKKSHGQLRQALEKEVWPAYGSGLWDESWAEFYGNLARAVQPYAHYTSELQGWQFKTLSYAGGSEFFAEFGLETYDALGASRITLLHMLLTWMLGRILLAEGRNPDVAEHREQIVRLGRELACSKLLFQGGEWWAQLAPHMLFRPGADWRDNN